MDTEARARLLFDIKYALEFKCRLDPRGRKRQHADDPAYEIAAEAILGHLVDTCGWGLTREYQDRMEEPKLGHSTGPMREG